MCQVQWDDDKTQQNNMQLDPSQNYLIWICLKYYELDLVSNCGSNAFSFLLSFIVSTVISPLLRFGLVFAFSADY